MKKLFLQKRARRHSGFSLMEVVIALSIFSIMAAVLLQAVSNVQEAFIYTREAAGRSDAKQFVMRRVMAAQTNEAVTAGGRVDLANGDSASWSATVLPTNFPDLHQVTVMLNWSDGDMDIIPLWAYRPEWSDATERSNLIQNLRTEYPQSRLSTY